MESIENKIAKLIELQNNDLEVKTILKEIQLGSYVNETDKISMEKVIESYQKKHDEICAELNNLNLLGRIAQLQKRYRGIFIARVVNAVCRGCRMAVPASIMVHLNNLDQLVYCENCGRILRKVEVDNVIVKDKPAPPPPKRGRKPKQPPKF